MKEPIMKEKDLVSKVNKQRNGKAAGVDGVKAVVMKHMVKKQENKAPSPKKLQQMPP